MRNMKYEIFGNYDFENLKLIYNSIDLPESGEKLKESPRGMLLYLWVESLLILVYIFVL